MTKHTIAERDRLRAINADLLAALEEVLRCFAVPSGPHCGNIVTGKDRAAARDQARAAIAKAKAKGE